jgi:hypothetical protein
LVAVLAVVADHAVEVAVLAVTLMSLHHHPELLVHYTNSL